MKKKTVALLLATLTMSSALAGCGSTSAESAVEQDTTEVNVQSDTESSDVETTQTAEEEIAEAENSDAESSEAEVADNSENIEENSDYVIELDPEYNVPTEELLKTFPIEHQTPAETDLSKKNPESYVKRIQ